MSPSVFRLANSSQGTRLRRYKLIKYLKDYDIKKILECGCGAGAYSSALNSIAESIYAFDLNYALVRIANSHVKRVRFFIADIQNVPIRNNAFDAVIAADIIEHLSKPDNAIRNIYNLLKTGGILILTVPSKGWGRLYRLLFMRKEDIGHHKLYDANEIKDIFEKEGFYLIRHNKIQNIISAFLDTLIAKISIIIFGKYIVLHSEMAVKTANNRLLSGTYCFLNMIIYPLIVFFEWIFPSNWKTEQLAVFIKK